MAKNNHISRPLPFWGRGRFNPLIFIAKKYIGASLLSKGEDRYAAYSDGKTIEPRAAVMNTPTSRIDTSSIPAVSDLKNNYIHEITAQRVEENIQMWQARNPSASQAEIRRQENYYWGIIRQKERPRIINLASEKAHQERQRLIAALEREEQDRPQQTETQAINIESDEDRQLDSIKYREKYGRVKLATPSVPTISAHDSDKGLDESACIHDAEPNNGSSDSDVGLFIQKPADFATIPTPVNDYDDDNCKTVVDNPIPRGQAFISTNLNDTNQDTTISKSFAPVRNDQQSRVLRNLDHKTRTQHVRPLKDTPSTRLANLGSPADITETPVKPQPSSQPTEQDIQEFLCRTDNTHANLLTENTANLFDCNEIFSQASEPVTQDVVVRITDPDIYDKKPAPIKKEAPSNTIEGPDDSSWNIPITIIKSIFNFLSVPEPKTLENDVDGVYHRRDKNAEIVIPQPVEKTVTAKCGHVKAHGDKRMNAETAFSMVEMAQLDESLSDGLDIYARYGNGKQKDINDYKAKNVNDVAMMMYAALDLGMPINNMDKLVEIRKSGNIDSDESNNAIFEKAERAYLQFKMDNRDNDIIATIDNLAKFHKHANEYDTRLALQEGVDINDDLVPNAEPISPQLAPAM